MLAEQLGRSEPREHPHRALPARQRRRRAADAAAGGASRVDRAASPGRLLHGGGGQLAPRTGGQEQVRSREGGGGPGAYADWVPTLRDRPKDKPFFLWLASTDPQRPFRDHAIAEPHRASAVAVPPYLPDTPEIREDLALYYDAIARLDKNVGAVLGELTRQGLAGSTVVIFLSHDGSPFARGKTTLLDSGIRTPLVVRWPAAARPGASSSSLVSAVDIAPSILELAGAEPVRGMQGQSFVPILKDPEARIRTYAFAEHNWHDYMAYERGVRSEGFTYVHNELPDLPATPPADVVRSATFQQMRKLFEAGKLTPAQGFCFVNPRSSEELYDLSADPQALVNVAGQAPTPRPWPRCARPWPPGAGRRPIEDRPC